MHSYKLALALVLLPGLPVATGEEPQAPDFKLEDVNPASPTHGRKLALRALAAERGVVLQFIASWCEPCREELPRLQELYAAGEAPLVFVAADEGAGPQSVLLVAERSALTAPVLFAPPRAARKLSRRWPYELLPATYFIDRTGTIRGSHQGRISTEKLVERIGTLLGR